MKEKIIHALSDAHSLLAQFMGEPQNIDCIERAAKLIAACFQSGHRVFSAGNGGSMCDAMHFAEELSGRFRENRKPLPALAISDPGYMSCVANDFGYDQVFARFLQAHAQKGDVFLAISTSGTSTNILAAAKEAKELGLSVIGLTGKAAPALQALVDVMIVARGRQYADRVQELHIKIIHILIECVEHSLGLVS